VRAVDRNPNLLLIILCPQIVGKSAYLVGTDQHAHADIYRTVWITYELNPDGTFGKIVCNSLSADNLGPISLPEPEPGVIRPM
jgi:hypothetical protein